MVFNGKVADDPSLIVDDVMKIRRGATATITNALIKGHGQVKDVLDFKDGAGNGSADTKIEYSLQFTTPILGKKVNGTVNTGNVVKRDGLKGADTSKFAWVRIKF